jgi:hypothetical protein
MATLELSMEFPSFEDYWQLFLGNADLGFCGGDQISIRRRSRASKVQAVNERVRRNRQAEKIFADTRS